MGSSYIVRKGGGTGGEIYPIVQSFALSSTWTVPFDGDYFIECFGPGGDGAILLGGISNCLSGAVGGAGSGRYSTAVVSLTKGTNVPITISSSISSFGSFLSAGKGGNAPANVSNANGGSGGAGGGAANCFSVALNIGGTGFEFGAGGSTSTTTSDSYANQNGANGGKWGGGAGACRAGTPGTGGEFGGNGGRGSSHGSGQQNGTNTNNTTTYPGLLFRGDGLAGTPSAQGGAGGGGFGGRGSGGMNGGACIGTCYYYAASGAGGGYGANAGGPSDSNVIYAAGGGGGFGGNGSSGFRAPSQRGSSLPAQGLGSGGISHQASCNSNQTNQAVFGGNGGGYGKGPHSPTGIVNIRYVIQGNKLEE